MTASDALARVMLSGLLVVLPTAAVLLRLNEYAPEHPLADPLAFLLATALLVSFLAALAFIWTFQGPTVLG